MSVNKIILVGRLGRDPELTLSQSGKSLCKFPLATDRRGRDGGTDWHNVVCFDRTAELCDQYLERGRQVYVEGRVEYDSYEKDGETKYYTSVVAHSVEFLSGGSGGGGRGGDRGPDGSSGRKSGSSNPFEGEGSVAMSDVPF